MFSPARLEQRRKSLTCRGVICSLERGQAGRFCRPWLGLIQLHQNPAKPPSCGVRREGAWGQGFGFRQPWQSGFLALAPFPASPLVAPRCIGASKGRFCSRGGDACSLAAWEPLGRQSWLCLWRWLCGECAEALSCTEWEGEWDLVCA